MALGFHRVQSGSSNGREMQACTCRAPGKGPPGPLIDSYFLVFAYFRWNLSTRPAVSTSFCLPVKKGWHLEQISRWISGLVDRVWKVSPHAQVTTASTYFG